MLKGKDIINTAQFSPQELNLIMNTAANFEKQVKDGEVIRNMEGQVVATLFFEPSTRTRLSFETAANRLGARVITVANPASSSVAKGESLADTIRTVDGYADVIVMRHPMKGSAQIAADNAEHPFINAGDGAGQHPTQALLDIYSIRKEKGALGGHTVAFVGDLKYGRAAKSFVLGISKFEPEKLYLISPQILRPKEDLLEYLSKAGVEHEVVEDLRSVLPELDVLYVTRIQRERFPDPLEYERVKGSYRVTADILAEVKDELVVLHPLPRVDELDFSVDSTRHARYFVQASYGVPLRMALLKLVLIGG